VVAQAQRSAGEYYQAIATYNRLAERFPESSWPLLRIAEVQVIQSYDEAMKTLRRAAELQDKSDEVYRAMAQVQLAAGLRPEAVNVARELQKAKPKSAAGYILEGDIYANGKLWPQALSAYRTAVSETKQSAAEVKLYDALVAAGQTDDAEESAAAWVKTYPHDEEVRALVAESAARRGDYAGALRHYASVLSTRPNDVAALNNAAWVGAKVGDAHALPYAERAHELAPQRADVKDTLGMLLVESGDTQRGVQLLRQALELAPASANIRLDLARALIKAGQKESARKELDELAKLGNQYAQQAEVTRLRGSL
jgi:putative PEP-CTERM system TPR-repeat lipoprotein